MNAYYVESGWKTGIVAANSALHALKIAEATALHKVGRKVLVLKIERTTLTSEVLDLVKKGPGRILPASIFRSVALLVNPEK